MTAAATAESRLGGLDGWGEQLVLCAAPDVGLRAIIAIDSTTLGPAVGGARMMRYASDDEAIADARRLAAAMTLKAALAGLPIGGGKAVIVGDPQTDKSEELLRAFGRFVASLGGRYAAAQDVGTSPGDLDIVARETSHVVGVSARLGGPGDPSPYTARGVHRAIRGWSAQAAGTTELSGRRVVVSGVGAVGAALAGLLVADGADVTVADVDPARVEALSVRDRVAVADPATAHAVACDVFAPCALGGVLSERTAGELRCSAVVGAANNQLVAASVATTLHEAGIVYVPDFLASAGGLTAGAAELLWPPFSTDRAHAAIDEIEERTRSLLEISAARGRPPLAVAHELARARINAARRVPHLRCVTERR